MGMLQLVGQDVRLWDYFQSKPYALLDTPSKTLADMQIIDNQDLLVELPDDKGAFHLKKAVANTYNGYYGRTAASGNARPWSRHTAWDVTVPVPLASHSGALPLWGCGEPESSRFSCHQTQRPHLRSPPPRPRERCDGRPRAGDVGRGGAPKPRQHLLHEQHAAVPLQHAPAAAVL